MQKWHLRYKVSELSLKRRSLEPKLLQTVSVYRNSCTAY